MFNRFICFCVGHKEFPPASEPVPEHPNGSLAILPNTTIGSTLNSITWVTPAEASLQVTRGPFSSTFSICARCQQVYWTTEPHLPTIVDSNKNPQMKEYYALKSKATKEEKERENNPLAKKLYQQYLVALKLAKPED